MLSKILNQLLFPVQAPLLWYLCLFVAISAGIVYFGFLYREQEKQLTETDALLYDAQDQLLAAEEEEKARDHDYANMALLIEDFHSQIEEERKARYELEVNVRDLSERMRSFTASIVQSTIVAPLEDDDLFVPDNTIELDPALLDGIEGLDSFL